MQYVYKGLVPEQQAHTTQGMSEVHDGS
jgi:hypothetical protein